MRMTEDEYADFQRRRNITEEIVKRPPKKSKYNNKRIRVDGILFDSKLEADYYSELKIQLQAGVIRGFCRQPEFILVAGFGERKPVIYKADFIVFSLDGTAEVIDTKGVETEVFRIKKKQFAEKFPELELKIVK